MDNLVTFITIRNGKAFKRRRYTVEQPAVYFAKKNGKVTRKRKIQYVPDMETVFYDEQIKIDPAVERENVYIDKGTLRIDKDLKPNLYDFLTRHHNFDVDFRLLDIENEQLFEIAELKATDEAKAFIFKADENIIRTIAIEIISPHLGQTRDVNKLRLELRQLADKNLSVVARINEFGNSSYNQEKLLVTALLTENIIKLQGKTFSWADSDEKIFTASQANDAPKDLAIWLKNDEEGRQTQSIFAKQLTTLKKQKDV